MTEEVLNFMAYQRKYTYHDLKFCHVVTWLPLIRSPGVCFWLYSMFSSRFSLIMQGFGSRKIGDF